MQKIDLTMAELKAGEQLNFFSLLEEELIANGHQVAINNVGRLAMVFQGFSVN